MLHIRIITVGKKHQAIFVDAIELYEKRLRRSCKLHWEIIPPSNPKDESNQIVKRLKGAKAILLDERGALITTQDLANQLEHAQLTAEKELVFIIGGAYGVESGLFDQVSAVFSLGNLTLPHQLVRVILLEQLYRSYDALHGGNYHHVSD